MFLHMAVPLPIELDFLVRKYQIRSGRPTHASSQPARHPRPRAVTAVTLPGCMSGDTLTSISF